MAFSDYRVLVAVGEQAQLSPLVAFAPLGVFFLRNPAFFSVRMGQASTLDPEIHGGDLWGTLGEVTLKALGVFTVRGDDNPIYNTPGKPVFGVLLGAAFYLGLVVCLWRAVRSPTHRLRTPYLLILVWLPAMMVPNILGARGVPHALRSMGVIPVVYYLPALGLAAAMRAAGISLWRLAAPLLILGMFFTVFQFFFQNFIVMPFNHQQKEITRTTIKPKREPSRLREVVRQDINGNILLFKTFHVKENRAEDVTVLAYEDSGLTSRWDFSEALWSDSLAKWEFQQGMQRL